MASLRFVVNRSWLRKRTRSPTPDFWRFAVASLMRCGSMSIPVARAAPKSFTAAIGMRPSPDPRSYTTSPLPTLATLSMAATTSGGVGTKITSGDRRGDWVAVCAAVAAGIASVTATRMAGKDWVRIIRFSSNENPGKGASNTVAGYLTAGAPCTRARHCACHVLVPRAADPPCRRKHHGLPRQ